ncbi:MAG TPA: bifunctional YncE family protein/alkaline phosphatase family protein [Acidimicrobiales bacterium]|jgi:DNA-binding beta-propeller fold protein YncE|nr:bifunctional YncE family protein/alkaline phosphatase family protein [Acidimicrobiales bacterium]
MRRFRTPLLALLVILALSAGLMRLAMADQTEGTTPNGWKIRPAGSQVDINRFPLGSALSPDGTKLVVSSDNGGMQALTTVDTDNLSTTITPAPNLFMGVAVTNDGTVFASGGNADRVFRYKLAGPAVVPLDLTGAQPVPVHHIADTVTQGQGLPVGDGIRVTGYPGNMLLDGNLLYVAGTLSEQPTATEPCPSGQPACARVTIIDTSANNGMGAVVGRAPVGMDAYGLALDKAHKRLYVSNWADESGRGGSTGGTVSVVDVSNPTAPHEVSFAHVGHQPEALQLSSDRARLFVTNTNDDTVSVLDVRDPAHPREFSDPLSTKPVDAPVGAHPDALTLSPDGRTLFVALAGMNAVQVIDVDKGKTTGYIPSGYYPSQLITQVTNAKKGAYRLWTVNTKGTGFGPGYNLSVGMDGSKPGSLASTIQDGGSLSRIDVPAKAADLKNQLKNWTSQVFANDKLNNVKVDPCKPGHGVRASEVLCPPGNASSPIKHVLYIVTENKTFDQYFGDINATGTHKDYDADPSYALYGQQVTPNHHALADRYSLGDRFFSDAEVSVTGHSWTAGAIATDHNEKTWQADYDQGIRGTHGGGDPLRPSVGSPNADKAISDADDQLQDPQGGYIFEAFKRAGAKPPSDNASGLTMAIYGERTARTSGDMSAYKAPNWKDGDIQYFDNCRADQFITGQTGGGNFPNNEGPGGVTARDCEKRTLPGQFNLQHWTDVFKATGKDVMPNFLYMSLPDNHTLGTNLGSPTPASMVADNDYAIGRIVEALSKSPFWGSTAVVQTEDDTQAAGDHISSLRDYLQVSSPWASTGAQHQWGSMPALLRTIEQIFHVQPVSLYDRLAMPMHDAFKPSLSDQPDLAPFTAVKPLVPFAINEVGAPDQALSQQQTWMPIDRVPMDVLNKIQYEAQGKVPPPG